MTSKISSAIKSNMNDKSFFYVQIGILSTRAFHVHFYIHFVIVVAAL